MDDSEWNKNTKKSEQLMSRAINNRKWNQPMEYI